MKSAKSNKAYAGRIPAVVLVAGTALFGGCKAPETILHNYEVLHTQSYEADQRLHNILTQKEDKGWSEEDMKMYKALHLTVHADHEAHDRIYISKGLTPPCPQEEEEPTEQPKEDGEPEKNE